VILATGTYTRRRGTAKAIDPATGHATTPTWSETSITANVQPLSPEQLSRLPEGDRVRDPRLVITRESLRTVDASSGAKLPADRVVIDGTEYEVFSVERYTAILPHYEAVVMRVAEPSP